jgi:hypothetical protein
MFADKGGPRFTRCERCPFRGYPSRKVVADNDGPGETVRRAALTMIEAPLESRQRGLYGSLAMFAVSAPLASAWPS